MHTRERFGLPIIAVLFRGGLALPYRNLRAVESFVMDRRRRLHRGLDLPCWKVDAHAEHEGTITGSVLWSWELLASSRLIWVRQAFRSRWCLVKDACYAVVVSILCIIGPWTRASSWGKASMSRGRGGGLGRNWTFWGTAMWVRSHQCLC